MIDGRGDRTAPDTMPQHRVTVSSFEMSSTEMTQYEMSILLGGWTWSAEGMQGATLPSGNIHWNACNEVLLRKSYVMLFHTLPEPIKERMRNWIATAWNFQTNTTGRMSKEYQRAMHEYSLFAVSPEGRALGLYRLPTEAEWEYAARGGRQYTYATYNGLPEDNHFSAVASRQPNPFGLYDLQGNLTEFVFDSYAPYTSASVVDPQVSITLSDPIWKDPWPNIPHVLRGLILRRTFARRLIYDGGQDPWRGFRAVRSIPTQ